MVFSEVTVTQVPGKELRPSPRAGPLAGVRPYGGDVWSATQGVITLEIGIHGIPVTMEQKIYDDVFNGALMGYWEVGMDNRDKSYYKRVVLGCIRALDYIEQYTPWNGKGLGVTGSSQGGFLTLASIRQMSRQVSRGSAGEYQAYEWAVSRGSVAEYQADERAGVARLSWRVSGR